MKRLDVITGTKNKEGDKTFWNNIGSAWIKDGEEIKISVKLNALPVSGELLLVEPKEKRETA